MREDLKSLLGQMLSGRYRIDALIGVGGMGAVFRAHHVHLRRDVAIKVLRPDLSQNHEVAARFEREAYSASRLEHPNCLQVTDYGTTPAGLRFLVMQLLNGVELKSILPAEGLPLARAIDVCAQMLRGLDHAHRRGVVHRDIKPENVVVTQDDDGADLVKIVDFGIAKIGEEVEGDSFTTRVGLIFGTPAYMSPEQASGLSADERADLYSTGVLFYQMVAGKVPFGDEDPLTLIRRHLTQAPPPLPVTTPPVLAAVIQQMLAKDRNRRFQTAAENLNALEQAAALLWPDGRPGAKPRGTSTAMPRMTDGGSWPAPVPAPTPAGAMTTRGSYPHSMSTSPGATVPAATLPLSRRGQRPVTAPREEPAASIIPDFGATVDEPSRPTRPTPKPTPAVEAELEAFDRALKRVLRDGPNTPEPPRPRPLSVEDYGIDLDNLEVEELEPGRFKP